MKELAVELYHAALDAVAPGPAVRTSLDGLSLALAPGGRVILIAAGKAAAPMAHSACDWLEEHGHPTDTGLIVAPRVSPAPRDVVEVIAAEHPVPGDGALRAGERLARLTADARKGDLAIVLLSGGASSLLGAPLPEIPADDVARLFELLLGSGLDIASVNTIRRRFTRFGGGRLAAALHGASVLCLVLSDVPGDDPALVGSGPCSPDPATARDVRRLLDDSGLLEEIPPSLRAHLSYVEMGKIPETPKEGAAALAEVRTELVARNADALVAACAAAAARGYDARIASMPLTGTAVQAGERLARELLALAAEGSGDVPFVLLAGGETTVRIEGRSGRGGRCQELALAAAKVLHEEAASRDVVLLAADSDGRDGPTDAAGAVVDATSWARMASAGHDPMLALETHDAYPALDSVRALLRTGPTETNVMDIAIGIVAPEGGR